MKKLWWKICGVLAFLAGFTEYVDPTWIILLISLSIWKFGSEFNNFVNGDFVDFLEEGTTRLP